MLPAVPALPAAVTTKPNKAALLALQEQFLALRWVAIVARGDDAFYPKKIATVVVDTAKQSGNAAASHGSAVAAAAAALNATPRHLPSHVRSANPFLSHWFLLIDAATCGALSRTRNFINFGDGVISYNAHRGAVEFLSESRASYRARRLAVGVSLVYVWLFLALLAWWVWLNVATDLNQEWSSVPPYGSGSIHLVLCLLVITTYALGYTFLPRHRTVGMREGALPSLLPLVLQTHHKQFMCSYAWSSSYLPLVRSLCEVLPDCWLDVRELAPGDRVPQEIVNAVVTSRCVVLFVTYEYLRSANCTLEALAALRHRAAPQKTILLLEGLREAVSDAEVDAIMLRLQQQGVVPAGALPAPPPPEAGGGSGGPPRSLTRTEAAGLAQVLRRAVPGLLVVTSVGALLEALDSHCLRASADEDVTQTVSWWALHGTARTQRAGAAVKVVPPLLRAQLKHYWACLCTCTRRRHGDVAGGFALISGDGTRIRVHRPPDPATLAMLGVLVVQALVHFHQFVYCIPAVNELVAGLPAFAGSCALDSTFMHVTSLLPLAMVTAQYVISMRPDTAALHDEILLPINVAAHSGGLRVFAEARAAEKAAAAAAALALAGAATSRRRKSKWWHGGVGGSLLPRVARRGRGGGLRGSASAVDTALWITSLDDLKRAQHDGSNPASYWDDDLPRDTPRDGAGPLPPASSAPTTVTAETIVAEEDDEDEDEDEENEVAVSAVASPVATARTATASPVPVTLSSTSITVVHEEASAQIESPLAIDAGKAAAVGAASGSPRPHGAPTKAEAAVPPRSHSSALKRTASTFLLRVGGMSAAAAPAAVATEEDVVERHGFSLVFVTNTSPSPWFAALAANMCEFLTRRAAGIATAVTTISALPPAASRFALYVLLIDSAEGAQQFYEHVHLGGVQPLSLAPQPQLPAVPSSGSSAALSTVADPRAVGIAGAPHPTDSAVGDTTDVAPRHTDSAGGDTDVAPRHTSHALVALASVTVETPPAGFNPTVDPVIPAVSGTQHHSLLQAAPMQQQAAVGPALHAATSAWPACQLVVVVHQSVLATARAPLRSPASRHRAAPESTLVSMTPATPATPVTPASPQQLSPAVREALFEYLLLVTGPKHGIDAASPYASLAEALLDSVGRKVGSVLEAGSASGPSSLTAAAARA